MEDRHTQDEFHVVQSEGSSLRQYLEHFGEYKYALDVVKKKIKSDRIDELRFFREFFNQKNNGLLYRKNGKELNPLITQWIAEVRYIASLYDRMTEIPEFHPITTAFMSQIALMSADTNNLKLLDEKLRLKGIIFILQPSIPGLKLDGAVFKLRENIAVLAMSLRHKRLDNFWFTLMHELAHLHLHSAQLSHPIIEDLEENTDTEIEMEADRIAGEVFIPKHKWRSSPLKYIREEDVVIKFAQELGIHPTIVAGRFRKESGNYQVFNKLINSFDVREYFNI